MKKGIALISAVLILFAFAGCVRTKNMTTNNSGADVNSKLAISEEEAKKIALEKAGLTADEVKFERVEFDRDDGVDHYEVEFRKDRTEYDADVSTDGTVISWEVDYND